LYNCYEATMTITGRSQVNMTNAKAAFGRKFSKSPRNLAPQRRNFDEMLINFNQSILMTEVMTSIEFIKYDANCSKSQHVCVCCHLRYQFCSL